MANKLFLVIILFLAVSVSAQEIEKKDSLPRFGYSSLSELNVQLDDIFNDPNFDNAEWGVVYNRLKPVSIFIREMKINY